MKHRRRLLLLLLPTALAACKETHSALSPHGPAAGQIATLTWILFGTVAVVMAIVLAATWIAILGSDRMRAGMGQVKAIVVGGLVFPAVVLTALLVYGSWLMRAQGAGSAEELRIEVRGEQWWWRVRYPLGDDRFFESANEIRIPVGRPVALTLTSADVIHSLWIPSLAGKMDMIPGRTTALRLRADRPGTYRGACAEYCGGPHALMAFHAVALAAPEFDRWLAARSNPTAPAGADAQRGQALFEAAGCGGCHAIDGTSARGTIGPNLSDVGARRSIGAGTLPMAADNLALFVAHGQRFKLANRMPPFAIFSDIQLSDLAAYLAALR